LRHSLKEAESSSEDYARQLAAAQSKADDLMTEQSRLEEQYQQSSDRVQELEFEQREAKRHAQEMERIYDGERNAMMRDREEAGGRENELKATIQRLKESIAEREFKASAGGQGNEAGGKLAS
jgi:chromosome segregation ATPase